MPTKRKDPAKTSVNVKLEGANYEAYLLFEIDMKKCGAFKSADDTINQIITQWRTSTPAVFRGYKK